MQVNPSHKQVCFLLVALQALLAVGFYFYFGGVAPAGDSNRYISAADYLLSGQPLIERQASYFTYVLILSFFKGLGLSLIWVVFFQWVVSCIAMLFLYKLALSLCNFPASMIAPLFFLFPDIQRWNQNILSDSLYISCVILLFYLLNKICTSTFRWRTTVFTFFFGVCTIFLRPNGWALIPVLLLAVFYIPNISILRKIVLFTVTGGVIFFLVSLVSSHSEGQSLYLGWTVKGEVIWNYPEGRISMPQPEVTLEGTRGLIQYLLSYPFSYLKLVLIRLLTEVSHYRVFYSTLHNSLSLLVVLTSYSFALIGFSLNRARTLVKLVFTACFFHLCIIGVTFADWDGRFLMHFFPLLLPFVSLGFSSIFQKSPLFQRFDRV